jgi:hypothetical protein
MEGTPTYRFYQQGDEFAIIDLRRSLREIKVRDRNSVVNWRHENLSSPEGESIVALATRGDRILSQFILLPRRLRVLGRELSSYQSLEVMTQATERRRGHFTRLGAMAQGEAARRGCDVLWAFPNRRSIGGFVGRFGWRVVGEVPLLARPVLGPVGALRLALLRGREEKDGFLLEQVEEFDEGIGELVDHLNRSHPVVFPRSLERLNWRYRSIGDRVYRKYLYRGGDGRGGFAVYRITRWGRLVMAVIMELHVRDGLGRAASFLERSLERVRRRYRPRLALAMSPEHTLQHRILRRAGFARLPNGLGPHRFRLTVKADESVRDLGGQIQDPDNWYLSFGDNDVF